MLRESRCFQRKADHESSPSNPTSPLLASSPTRPHLLLPSEPTGNSSSPSPTSSSSTGRLLGGHRKSHTTSVLHRLDLWPVQVHRFHPLSVNQFHPPTSYSKHPDQPVNLFRTVAAVRSLIPLSTRLGTSQSFVRSALLEEKACLGGFLYQGEPTSARISSLGTAS